MRIDALSGPRELAMLEILEKLQRHRDAVVTLRGEVIEFDFGHAGLVVCSR